MNIIELFTFMLVGAVFVFLGKWLMMYSETAGWLVASAPIVLLGIFVMSGLLRCILVDVPNSFRKLPACLHGKSQPRHYIYVGTTSLQESRKVLFRCHCGDLYVSDGKRFALVLSDGSQQPYMVRTPEGWKQDNR